MSWPVASVLIAVVFAGTAFLLGAMFIASMAKIAGRKDSE